jgi:hypothetical protein
VSNRLSCEDARAGVLLETLARDATEAAFVDAVEEDVGDATEAALRVAERFTEDVADGARRAGVRGVVAVGAGTGFGQRGAGPGCCPSFECSCTQNACQSCFAAWNTRPFQDPPGNPETETRATPLK